MNWLTKEQITAAAKEGKLPALRMSFEHHDQGAKATLRELLDALEDGLFNLGTGFCACCVRAGNKEFGACHENCPKCPLHEPSDDLGCCGDLYDKADGAIEDLEDDHSNANFAAFQQAERAICDYISKVIEQEEAKAKKETKRRKTDSFSSIELPKDTLTAKEDDGGVDFWFLREGRPYLIMFDIDTATEFHKQVGEIIDTLKESKQC